MTMRNRLPKLMPTALAAFLAIGGAAEAQECSTAALHGMYSLSFHGETLGVLSGTPPVLTPFASPNIVDGVEIITFDGAGGFQSLAFAMRNGVPVAAGQSGLNDNGFQPQFGTYSVSSDCTGAGTITQPGMSATFALVLSDKLRKIRYVPTSQHVAQIPNNPNCAAPAGCDVAIQIIDVGEKVSDRED